MDNHAKMGTAERIHGDTHQMKGIRRLGAIAAVLAKHGYGTLLERMFGQNLSASETEAEHGLSARPAFHSPARLRLMLEELGPSFIKLGQLMSVRADVLPAENTEELKKLQDSIPAVPFTIIRTVVEGELGAPLEHIFSEFKPEAMAAASVAQVHEAEGGTEMVGRMVLVPHLPIPLLKTYSPFHEVKVIRCPRT